MPVDPVCRKELEAIHAGASMKYDGHTIYFCSVNCRDSFKRNPGMFVKGATVQKQGFFKKHFS